MHCRLFSVALLLGAFGALAAGCCATSSTAVVARPTASVAMLPAATPPATAPAPQIIAPAPAATRTIIAPATPPLLVGPSVVVPRRRHPLCPFSWFPEPAFAPPALPSTTIVTPPSATPSVVTPSTTAAPPQLVLTPGRVVAPVGGSVVLTAGLQDSLGRLISGQRIQWALSEGAAGRILAVGENQSNSASPSGPAVGQTSAQAHVITHDNADPSDDVTVPAGFSWIRLTSDTEGTTQVTASAPDLAGSQQQTATVYWVSAQWALPPPADVPAGQPHTLTTTVTRPQTGEPLAGWLVRYEIVSGIPATFTANGAQAIEAQTDASGKASVEIAPRSRQSGSVQVRVQIIRTDPEDGSRVPVGQGFTTVTWRAPGLAIDVQAPQVAEPGGVIPYRLVVSNPGEHTASDVTVTDRPPPGLAYVSSDPQAEQFGDRLRWRLGDLRSQAAQTIQLQLRAGEAGEFNNCATAEAAGGLSVTDCARTQIVAPQVSLRITGPERAQVGQQVQFQVEVANTGAAALSNLSAVDKFDAGLVHQRPGNEIERPLGNLAPGESRQFIVSFRVNQAGKLCHTVEIRTESGVAASQRACITAVEAPQPNLDVQIRKTGPAQARVGQTVEFVIEVVNVGEGPLTGLRIVDAYDPILMPVSAEEGFAVEQGRLVWEVARLAPGQKVGPIRVRCQCQQPSPAAANRATVTNDQQVMRMDTATVRILPAEQAAPPSAEQPGGRPAPPARLNGDQSAQPAPQRSGNLVVTISDRKDPIRVGQSTTYLVIVKNDRNEVDENVTLQFAAPQGMRIQGVSGPSKFARSSADARTVEVAPVAAIRAGETLPAYEVEVTASRAGEYRFQVEVGSKLSPEPIIERETTTVLKQ